MEIIYPIARLFSPFMRQLHRERLEAARVAALEDEKVRQEKRKSEQEEMGERLRRSVMWENARRLTSRSSYSDDEYRSELSRDEPSTDALNSNAANGASLFFGGG